MASRGAARWWHRLDDGRIQCDLCPHACMLRDGQRGACVVRHRTGDTLELATYGLASGFCIDPIEKKPLSHFYPGTGVLSFGTVGCNLSCQYCQNWDISATRDPERLQDSASPADIAETARSLGCRSVAFTYNDPVIFAEYAMDSADACRAVGVATVAVTAGYINPGPRAEFFAHMDAANVDLKAFTEGFYHRYTRSHLRPVLDTLTYLAQETSVWLEITTLLIPGLNDSPAEIRDLSRWVVNELGPDVPLHFSAFHPSHRLRSIPATPPRTLREARAAALDHGVHHVYTGNISDVAGSRTHCPGCQRRLIDRRGYSVVDYALTTDARCPACSRPLAGRFDARAGEFDSRRIPVRIRQDL